MKGNLMKIPVILGDSYYVYTTVKRQWQITRVKYRARGQKAFKYWQCKIFDNRFKDNNGGILPFPSETLDNAVAYIDEWEVENA